MKQSYDKYDFVAAKRLSQNFIIEPNTAKKIVSYLEIEKDEFILEVGPGLGAVTEIIFNQTKNLFVIEKDERLSQSLLEILPRQQITIGDALEVSWAFPHKFKLISNIPYNISKKLIKKVIQEIGKLKMGLFLVQKEFAEKVENKGSKSDTRSISILVNLFCEFEYLQEVPASVFYPKPHVESALIKLTPKKTLPPIPIILFVESGFKNKRKKLHHNLESIIEKEKLCKHLTTLGISIDVRAEELNEKQWFDLYMLTQRIN